MQRCGQGKRFGGRVETLGSGVDAFVRLTEVTGDDGDRSSKINKEQFLVGPTLIVCNQSIRDFF